jgi:S-adenosylmethionine:tRNA ribosyltransferase-isomerase
MSAGAPAVEAEGRLRLDPVVDFELPPELEAGKPPEAEGRARDDVRLLVARRGDGSLRHLRFPDIVDVLEPGDLLVVNTSATVPAAVDAEGADGTPLRLHLATPLPAGLWLAELRVPVGAGTLPFADGRAGERLALPGAATVHLLRPYAPGAARLWVAALDLPTDAPAYLAAHGSPVRYAHAGAAWPLADYQNVYATEPGSAEMPSAGRPFTTEVLTRLVATGIGVAPVVLHCGLSSPEAHEPPMPERYRVPAATARHVNATRDGGGRVVAVGTTVVRALETTADHAGRSHPGEGWTDLVVTPERGVRAVDGLLTGWHEPAASHLQLLEAVAGRDVVVCSYREALAYGYRWHEFGDVHLVLP